MLLPGFIFVAVLVFCTKGPHACMCTARSGRLTLKTVQVRLTLRAVQMRLTFRSVREAYFKVSVPRDTGWCELGTDQVQISLWVARKRSVCEHHSLTTYFI